MEIGYKTCISLSGKKRAANAGTECLGWKSQPLLPTLLSEGFSSVLWICVCGEAAIKLLILDFQPFSKLFLKLMHSSPAQSPTTHTCSPTLKTVEAQLCLNEQNIQTLCALQRATGTCHINICFTSHGPANCLQRACLSIPPDNFLLLLMGQFSPSLPEKQKPKRNEVSTSFMKIKSQQKESNYEGSEKSCSIKVNPMKHKHERRLISLDIQLQGNIQTQLTY